jgi:hypothetical protein
MALVVFMRGAKNLDYLSVLNVGAAGTFIIPSRRKSE